MDAFANFMGYIQSIKEGEVFAWSDDSQKFNSTIDELENFYFANKYVIDLHENYLLLNRPYNEKIDKIDEIFSYLGFDNESRYLYINETNKIDKWLLKNFVNTFTWTENDSETFNNLRNKDSFGKFRNVEMNQTVLKNLKSENDIPKSQPPNEQSLITQNYFKLTIRILKMIVIFQKPKCFEKKR